MEVSLHNAVNALIMGSLCLLRFQTPYLPIDGRVRRCSCELLSCVNILTLIYVTVNNNYLNNNFVLIYTKLLIGRAFVSVADLPRFTLVCKTIIIGYMSNPFTIRIYVPEGDPEGLRIIERQSSPSKFFAFPRNKWDQIKDRTELTGAGIYILTGYSNPEDELPTVYVGQADIIKNRIEQHIKNKDFWDKAVIFVSDNKINSTHAKWLEHKLIDRVFKANRSIVENGNNPQEPTISEAEQAEMQVFLTEIYQTLPLVGLRAFDVPRAIIEPVKEKTKDQKDTIVVPAQEEGFNRVFIGEQSWYAVRISGGMLDNIKYIAGYQTAPVSAITHYAKVKSIEPYGEEGKYKLNFVDKAIKLENEIEYDLPKGAMQGLRYTSLDKLLKAKKMSELF